MADLGSRDLNPAMHRFVEGALADEHYETLFEALCDDLARARMPLLRAHLTMQTLHPLVASVDLTWLRGAGLEVNTREFTPEPPERWLRSPLCHMLETRQRRFRARLDSDDAPDPFPLFAELRTLGATDYLGLMTPFGDPDTAYERRDGIITSWVSDAPGGFSADDIAALDALQCYVGVIAKLARNHHTTRNILSAYLGEDAGRRVLEGQIRLGDVVRIPAVIWFSDLRDSTAMAERMSPETFLEAVNAYFDCTAGAVLAHDGEVLRFIGDAVLAVFPISDEVTDERAARQALAASYEARRRMSALNTHRTDRSLEPLSFGLGLHVGELLYGNIGVPSRIEFSVIGRAANEVARLEGLTKAVTETVLVSQEFSRTIDLDWRDLGTHSAKGVGNSMHVFAPPDDSSVTSPRPDGS